MMVTSFESMLIEKSITNSLIYFVGVLLNYHYPFVATRVNKSYCCRFPIKKKGRKIIEQLKLIIAVASGSSF